MKKSLIEASKALLLSRLQYCNKFRPRGLVRVGHISPVHDILLTDASWSDVEQVCQNIKKEIEVLETIVAIQKQESFLKRQKSKRSEKRQKE